MTLRIRLMTGVDRRCATTRHRDSTARPRALSRSRMQGHAPARGPRCWSRPTAETKARWPARLGARILREQPPRRMALSPERPRRRRNPRRHGDAVADANCDADKAGSALWVVTRSTTSRPRCRGGFVLHDGTDRMRTLNAAMLRTEENPEIAVNSPPWPRYRFRSRPAPDAGQATRRHTLFLYASVRRVCIAGLLLASQFGCHRSGIGADKCCGAGARGGFSPTHTGVVRCRTRRKTVVFAICVESIHAGLGCGRACDSAIEVIDRVFPRERFFPTRKFIRQQA